MSERGEVLRIAMYSASFGEEHDKELAVARAICEHLGLTWEMVEEIGNVVRWLGEADPNLGFVFAVGETLEAADAIATLLEAVGIEP